MNVVDTIVVWLHVLAAMVWLGGMVFVSAVLGPSARRLWEETERMAVFNEVGSRFRVLGWVAISILLATGVFNALRLIPSPEALLTTRFGVLLSIKLVLVFIMVVLSILHDFVLGPRLVETRHVASPHVASPRVASLQRMVVLLAQLNLIVGLVVVFLAVGLRRL